MANAALIHNAISDSAPTLRVGPHPAGLWDNLCPKYVSGAVAVRYLGADMC
jgi:hypothetical protein